MAELFDIFLVFVLTIILTIIALKIVFIDPLLDELAHEYRSIEDTKSLLDSILRELVQMERRDQEKDE